jgi:hypothetical protein
MSLPQSPPESPTMPTLAPADIPTLTLLEPVAVSRPDFIEPVAAAVSSAVAKLSFDQEALMKIVTDLVAKKPSSPQEALKLLAELQGKIAEWVVSELPEKDKILAGLKMAETVAASVGCLPCFRR